MSEYSRMAHEYRILASRNRYGGQPDFAYRL